MRILAIDDESIFCSLLKVALDEMGYSDTSFAQSGHEALSVLQSTRQAFDCFLVDIRMAPMDGIELVRRIRAIADYRRTPIIMISALTEKSAIDAAFLAGANDYITKPLDKIELKARLSMARNINEARAQARSLQEHVQETESKQYESLRFEDAFLIDEVESLTSMTALENYVLKLGNLRLHSSCAVAFRIENASGLFARLDPIGFSDIMADVATLISNAISGTPHMLAYAGSGIFVAVAPRNASIDHDSLKERIDDLLLQLSHYYKQAGFPLPELVAGHPARNGILSLESPTRIIEKAIDSVQRQEPARAAKTHVA